MIGETTKDERFKHVTERNGFAYIPPKIILTNVSLHNRGYALEWNLDLLDNGNEHTQDEWISLLAKRTWRLPTTVEYGQVISRLKTKSYSEDFPKSQEQVLFELICKVFDQSPVATSTRVTYNPSGYDTVTHFYGTNYALDVKSDKFRGHNQYLGLGNAQEKLLSALFSDAESSYDWDSKSLLGLQEVLTLKRWVRGCGNTYTDAYPFLQRLERPVEGPQMSPVFFHLSDTAHGKVKTFGSIIPDTYVLQIAADAPIDTPMVALGVRARRLEDVNR